MVRRKLPWVQWILLALLLLPSPSVLFSQPGVSADESEIKKLLSDLSEHSIKPSSVLDPSLNQERRDKNLAYFTDSYQLRVVPTAPFWIKADGSADVSVRVEFKNATTELSADSTARFIKRNGVWYYADFDFLGFPPVLILTMVIGFTVAVSYATTVLVLRWRLVRHGRLSWSNRVKLFIPIFWPRLFSRGDEAKLNELKA